MQHSGMQAGTKDLADTTLVPAWDAWRGAATLLAALPVFAADMKPHHWTGKAL